MSDDTRGLHKKLNALFGDNYELYLVEGGGWVVTSGNETWVLGSLRQAMLKCDGRLMGKRIREEEDGNP